MGRALKSSRRLATWGAVAAAVVATVGWRATRPTVVDLVRPRRQPVVAEVFGTGTLEAKVVVSASAKMVGKVVEVLADQGDSVEAGQCLARLESEDYQEGVRVAQARLAQGEAELSKARADLARADSLFRELTLSRAELDAQETAAQVAAARLDTARAELGFARARLSDTRIVSPIRGLVVTRNLETGSTVVPGTPIFRIADTDLLWVQAMVDEREAGLLRVGAPAKVAFRSDPATPFTGILGRMAREADRVTEELRVDVTVDALPPRFALGQKADVLIETARQDRALAVPTESLTRRGTKTGVLLATGGRAAWKEVRLGVVGRDTAEVVDGLSESDLVVRAPSQGKTPLRDGQRVRARAAGTGS